MFIYFILEPDQSERCTIMIIIILVMSIITLFILCGVYGMNNTGKVWTISIALLIIIWYTIELSNIFIFNSYFIKEFIFEDHWFLSSLTLGSLFFFALILLDLNFKRKRAKMIANETVEERQLREEKEAKIREQAQENLRHLQSQQAEKQRLQTASAQSYTELKCPKCGSINLTANNKGFSLGKAAVGGILLGPVGLLGGLLGSKKAVFICLKCGNQFEK